MGYRNAITPDISINVVTDKLCRAISQEEVCPPDVLRVVASPTNLVVCQVVVNFEFAGPQTISHTVRIILTLPPQTEDNCCPRRDLACRGD